MFSNGVNDSRMGTAINKMLCSTCGENIKSCPGHIGHLDLVAPVVNAMFIKVIFKVLSSVCFFCSRMLCKARYIEIARSRPIGSRLSYIYDKIKSNSACPECGELQPTWKKLHNTMVVPILPEEYSGTVVTHVSPERLVMVLKYIRRQDISLLGLHPDHSPPYALFWKNLIIPSVSIRPSRSRESNLKVCCEDELTIKLRNIVKLNNQLKGLVNSTSLVGEVNLLDPLLHRGFKSYVVKTDTKSIAAVYLLLQRSISAFADSKFQPPSYDEYGVNRMSIKERIVGKKPKESRLRFNVFGKRQNVSARTVITPSSDIEVDEIGVPLRVCQVLTFPERVNQWNIHTLLEKIRRGPLRYPGANHITRSKPDGSEVTTDLSQLTYIQRSNINLKFGDTVKRHLVDGDWVLMNRQPSLHRLSVMSHRIKLLPGNSFRLHLACTKSYNADFDGDEMNLMPAQSYESKAEMQELLSVGKNILKDGQVWVSFQQHAPAAVYILTLASTVVPPEWASVLLTEYPEVNLPRSAITGRELFSYTLPRDFNLSTGTVCVTEGELTSTLTKKTLNEVVVREYVTKYTSEQTIRFMSSLQRLLETYLRLFGLTLSPRDYECHIDYEATQVLQLKTEDLTRHHKHRVQHVSRSSRLYRHREANIVRALDDLRQIEGGEAVHKLQNRKNHHNGMFYMVHSGSKGDLINIIQNTAMVGQQLDHLGRRLLVRPGGNPFELEECGFIKNSFASGMSPMEYFCHLRASRVGLVDTAVKTGETGYTARRLCKLLESIKITRGWSGVSRVTDNENNIIQFHYSYDNLNNTALYAYALPVDFDLRVGPFVSKLFHPLPRPKELHALRKWNEFDPLRYPIQIWNCGPVRGKVLLHFSISDAVTHYTRTAPSWDVQLHRCDLEDIVLQFIDRLDLRTLGLRCLFLCELAPWKLPPQKHTVVALLRQVRKLWFRGQVEPGEAVGIRAGQNCAHPMTQLALNTFHHSGEVSNLVSGVNLIKDVVNILKNPAGPKCRVLVPPGMNAQVFGEDLLGRKLSCLIESWGPTEEGFSFTTTCPQKVLPFVEKKFKKNVDVLDGTTIKVYVNQKQRKCAIRQIARRLKTNKLNFDTLAIHSHMALVFFETNVGISEFTDFYIEGAYVVMNGSNFRALLCALNTRSKVTCESNHIRQIADTLGIDAARNSIRRELAKILSSEPVTVRHLHLLASVMTYTGTIQGATQSGIDALSTSVIQKASFEKTMNVLLNGAAKGAFDKNNTTAENIMWNTRVPVGTGSVTLNTATTPENVRTYQKGYREVKHITKPCSFFRKIFGDILKPRSGQVTKPNESTASVPVQKIIAGKKDNNTPCAELDYYAGPDAKFVCFGV